MDRARREAIVKSAARPLSAGAAVAGGEVRWIPYGPADEAQCVEVAADLGAAASEYACIRRGAGVMDSTQRGTLEVRGTDRVAFLQRMVTQDLSKMQAGEVRESFWLNRKGRIEADLLMCDFGDCMLIDVDRFAAARAAEQLQAFVFSEDVAVRDAGDAWARLSMHGPATLRLLEAAGHDARSLATSLRAASGTIARRPVRCARRDQTGEIGVEIFCAAGDLTAIWSALMESAQAMEPPVRPIGWNAFNTARIEAGTPLFMIDFGTQNLPHESGALARRVSFRKGCYLGQEVVARMESLGRPKQVLRALRLQGEAIPVAGAQIFAPAPAGGEIGACIGAVTSSTPAPMLGSVGVALGMVRSDAAAPGGEVVVAAEGAWTRATIQESLSFLGTPAP